MAFGTRFFAPRTSTVRPAACLLNRQLWSVRRHGDAKPLSAPGVACPATDSTGMFPRRARAGSPARQPGVRRVGSGPAPRRHRPVRHDARAGALPGPSRSTSSAGAPARRCAHRVGQQPPPAYHVRQAVDVETRNTSGAYCTHRPSPVQDPVHPHARRLGPRFLLVAGSCRWSLFGTRLLQGRSGCDRLIRLPRGYNLDTIGFQG